MPPFNRRRYFYRNWWNKGKRRKFFRRRRFGTTFRYRKRRHRRVRRKKFSKYFKKLKRVKIQQWQPLSIKKCKIEGYLPLFQAGPGRVGNNYALWKESYFPEHYSGGGGWSIQQLSLGILFTQHTELMNYWTRSNNRLNMCRYFGAYIYLFREPFVDYVFTYMDNVPKNVTKYYYNSHHPIKLLTYKRKITVPSFQTQPHKRKPYKRLYIPPPKLMKNQWFFQAHLADYPLVTFAVSSCSLTGMFGSYRSISNNVTLYCLDTKQFTHPTFQYKGSKPPDQGYTFGTNYLYGIPHATEIFKNNKRGDTIYLGNTMTRQIGATINQMQPSKYEYANWGNPFYYTYINMNMPTFITSNTLQTMIKTKTQPLGDTGFTEKETPYIFKVRYNPFHDKGDGNQIYLVPTYDNSKTNWEPTSDPDLKWENFPLWIMFWGLEDIVKRMGKCKNLDMDWVIVVKSKYLVPPEPYYVFVSEDFTHGRGPYDTDEEFMTRDDYTHWYPRVKYQRQPIDSIIRSGPAVATGDNCKNIQAKMKYTFLFKWGGNSSPQETIYDPNSQPITPSPNNFYSNNEIIDPTTDITTEIYSWDFRRHFLTETAQKRITESSTDEKFMFTDGRQTSTDIALWKTETQEKETEETQTETLFKQLNQLQQYNNQLQQRLRNLKQLSMDL